MSTYVVGDIQGCATELHALMGKIKFKPDSDTLWVAGDMINRGPDNVAVLDTLMSLPNVQCVLGNHDLHFLAVANGQQTPKRKDTIHDLLDHPRLRVYVDWLQQLPLAHFDPNLDALMVHAGVPPIWSLTEVMTYANEVETCLRSQEAHRFLKAMYGNDPDKWDSSLEGMARLRVITNYLTRIRFCKPSGKVDLTHKADVAPTGYAPWFELSFRITAPTKILFGHWAALGGVTHGSISGLDTGCVWGASLSAMRLEDGKMYSTPAATEHVEIE